MATVIVSETLDPQCAQWLSQHAQVVDCNYDPPDEFHRQLADADALVVRTYTQVNDALLDHAPQLKVVGRAGVGLDNVDVSACRKRGVQVVYTPEANSQAVVEYVLALILDALRPRRTMHEHVDDATFHHWRMHELGRQLDELTLGIVGFGRIGQRLGRVAHALGMNLLINDLLPLAELRQAAGYPFGFVEKHELYAQSDIVTIHVDGRSSNRHMIDAEALGQLKSNVLFINAARGMLVDNTALTDWARTHRDAQVVLDVHDPEPPGPDYPLWGLPNVRLLPHVASRTTTAMQNMSWVVRDVAAVLQGHQPQYPA